MKYVLWTLQILLALFFLLPGIGKLTQPMDVLVAQMVWPGALPEALVRFIGLMELLGVIGLLLPAATRIQPWLTPLAAAGLALTMVLAALFHLVRGEILGVPMTLVVAALAAFVAYGRLRLAPVQPRSGGRPVTASA